MQVLNKFNYECGVREITLKSILLLAIFSSIPFASVLAASQAERDGAIKAVETACNSAQEIANKMQKALDDIRVVRDSLNLQSKSITDNNSKAPKLLEDISVLNTKATQGKAKKDELKPCIEVKNQLAKVEKESSLKISELKEKYNSARKEFGLTDSDGLRKEFDKFDNEARDAYWVDDEKIKEAQKTYESRIQFGILQSVHQCKEEFAKLSSEIDGLFSACEASKKNLLSSIHSAEISLVKLEALLGPVEPLSPSYCTVQFLHPDGREIQGYTYKFLESEPKGFVRPKKDPSLEWHRFKYWSLDKDGKSGKYENWGKDRLDSNNPSIALYAIWEEVPVVARFYFDENKSKLLKEFNFYRTKSQIFELPSQKDIVTPTRWGYTFGGWKKINDKKPYSFGNTLSADVDIVPIWKEIPFKVVCFDFDKNGKPVKFGGEHSITLSQELPSKYPTLEGYKYIGWGIIPANEKNLSEDKIQKISGKKLSDYIAEPATAVNLYAIRELVQYKVKFVDLDGKIIEEVSGSAKVPVKPIKAPARNGYRFIGWVTEGDQNPWKGGPVFSDIVLTPKYQAISYKALFMTGKNVFETIEYSVEKPLLPPTNIPSRVGWTFQKWSKAPDRYVAPEYDKVTAVDRIQFYAMGELSKITFKFYSMGTFLETVECQYGKKVAPPALVDLEGKPTAPVGWGSRSNASTKDLFNFNLPVTGEDKQVIKLYAVWPEELWSNPPRIHTKKEWDLLNK